jgi:hypothetical protein
MNEDEMSVDSETDNANLTTEVSKKHKQQMKQSVGLPDENLHKMYIFLEKMSGGLDPN